MSKYTEIVINNMDTIMDAYKTHGLSDVQRGGINPYDGTSGFSENAPVQHCILFDGSKGSVTILITSFRGRLCVKNLIIEKNS